MFGSFNLFFSLRKIVYILVSFLVLFMVAYTCQVDAPNLPVKEQQAETSLYLNHADSAKYVGMSACKLCHQSIYSSFIKTGMGKSFDIAKTSKSSASFEHPTIYDKVNDLHYKAFWKEDSLYFQEYRLKQSDTSHSLTKQVNFIIGSGQHTNSHLMIQNGYLYQMPMTYYTQKGKWDLPPGFENGHNTRFSRKMGLECISCHNAYPTLVAGSENKYSAMPQGIDCERCHGPGSIHVAQRSMGTKVDTSTQIDYSIVNPSKLPIDRQFDVCQRCHLQGNAVLKNGKSFYDFKPGQKLSDFISVFLPKYAGADEEFIMASHADRLKQSACFIKSYEKVQSKNKLKPYKEALTCITCHNPHVSVKETNPEVFNKACRSCHKQEKEIETAHVSLKTKHINDCVSCHMPVSGSVDIPHVSIHDHYIRKPVTQHQKQKIKTFLGLFSVNEKNPGALTKAMAYLNQYDKFEPNKLYLDSAEKLLDRIKNKQSCAKAYLQLYFVKQAYTNILALVKQLGEENCYKVFFLKKSVDNSDAWAAYRIAEAYYQTGEFTKALKWFTRSVQLAPYHSDFRIKLGSTYASLNNLNAAKKEFTFVLEEDPQNISAYTNLGYIFLAQGNSDECIRLYKLGEKLDPDNESLLLNLAAYYMFMGNKNQAMVYLQRVIKLYPTNRQAIQVLSQLQSPS